MLDDDEKDRFITGIFFDAIRVETLNASLPKKVYLKTAGRLTKAVTDGYKGTKISLEFGKPDEGLLKQLRESIYMFSGAKTATQVEDIKSLMLDGKYVRPLSEFKKLALERFEAYNGKEGYLESEYITANTAGSSAANYSFAQENSELFPYLRSVAIIDPLTAPECERMNGVVAKVDDPIWNHNIAPRHWRCRCHEEMIDKYEKVNPTGEGKLKAISDENDKDMRPVFKMNPAKDKYVFSPKHPYFDIAKKYPDLAHRNFNLHIPPEE